MTSSNVTNEYDTPSTVLMNGEYLSHTIVGSVAVLNGIAVRSTTIVAAVLDFGVYDSFCAWLTMFARNWAESRNDSVATMFAI